MRRKVSPSSASRWSPPEQPADVREGHLDNLEEARADAAAYPDSALAAIWVGRREAYLGNYSGRD